MPAPRGLVLPAQVTRPALALGAVTLALSGVSRTTGSGWLVVVTAGLVAVMALAAVLPALGLARVTVGLHAPRDATVGRPTELTVELGGGSRPVVVRPVGWAADWTGAVTPCRGALEATPRRRGVHDSLTVEVRCAAPLGLVWWRRRFSLPLARPLFVGPRPAGGQALPPGGVADDGTDAAHVTSTLADAVRTIREYAAGDPIKLVHWAATARAGEVMVKELESPGAPVLSIAVDLHGGAEAAVEEAASRAAGLALAALGAGMAVWLATAERAGPRDGPVSGPLEVGRRLAAAVPGPLPRPRPGARTVLVQASGPGRARQP